MTRNYNYTTRDKEAGNVIDIFKNHRLAKKALSRYEKEDKIAGTYSSGFYEIKKRRI